LSVFVRSSSFAESNVSGESENPSEGTGEQLGWEHDALSKGLADALSQKLASPERRQVAAAVDLTVVFGLTFAFQAAVAPPNWGFFIALGVIWFLVEVPPIAFCGRSIVRPPGWRGGDRLAIHGGGSIGTAASNGCLHADEANLH
jgi:hypothetical protein